MPGGAFGVVVHGAYDECQISTLQADPVRLPGILGREVRSVFFSQAPCLHAIGIVIDQFGEGVDALPHAQPLSRYFAKTRTGLQF
ncbi:hypothetical protein D3C72_1954160 [compost metagenome]